MSKIIYKYFFYAIATLTLLISAFINKYPIIFIGDSFAYFINGKLFQHLNNSHSFIYSLFVYYTCLGSTFWGVVFVQSFIMAIVLFKTIDVFVGEKVDFKFKLFIVFLLVLLTSITKYTGKVLPDVFTGIIMLLFYIYIFDNKLSLVKRCIVLGSIFVLLLFHYSFVFIFILFTSSLLLVLIFFKEKKLIKKAVISLLIAFSPTISMQLSHYLFFKKYYFNEGSHIYLTAKISDEGILKSYLEENCGSDTTMMCKYKNDYMGLHTFLWEPQSPQYTLFGGVYSNSKPYLDSLNYKILTTPKYSFKFLYAAISNTFIGLVNFAYKEQSGTFMVNLFKENLPNELPKHQHSRQYNQSYDSVETVMNIIEVLSVLISILLLYYFIVIREPYQQIRNQKFLLISIIIILFTNSLVCGSLAELVGRFTQRIVWLLPFCAILVVIFSIKYKMTTKDSHNV